MSLSNERVSKRWNNPETSRINDSSSNEELYTDSTEYSPHVKNISTPLRSRRTHLEEVNRFRRSQGKIEHTEEASSDEKQSKRFQRRKERHDREKYRDDRDRIIERQKGRHSRRGKRRHDSRSEDSENEKQEETSGSESSDRKYGESDMERSKRKKRNLENNELPITELLRRSQENERTKYENQVALPVLTTDKVYVQHRGGFSAMKINQAKNSHGEKKSQEEENADIVDNQNSPPIKVAIKVQQFSKNIGLLYQGLLGGMALLHFIMLQVFFNNSTEFILKYSRFSEIYTSIYSFLVAMCIVTTFDKFDVARFDMEHLQELYFDYNRAVIAVPLYLAVFCLHQVCAGTNGQLNLIRYYSFNDTAWQNATNVQSLLKDLNSWQKISMSKDILAVFAWLFVSLGTKDDSFLMYLQSIEKYVNDVESFRR